MIIRSLAVVATLLMAASAGASPTTPPPPLRGVPLTVATGLRLLVADDPPFVLDVDTGRIKRVSGLDVRDHPVLSVIAAGKSAVVWLDRRTQRSKVPAAEIYVVRPGGTKATRIATAWDVAPSPDGGALWLKSYRDARHCTLREIDLSGHVLRRARSLPCSTRLVDGGSGALLVQGTAVLDPTTTRPLLRTRGLWALAARFALSSDTAGSLALTDLQSGERRQLVWPSDIGRDGGQAGRDQAAVQPDRTAIAVSFSDPAYEYSGTQVTDLWLLDSAAGSFSHLPDMPADVDLKFTSMSWTRDGRLVILAQTDRSSVVAVWRAGDARIATRIVRLPSRKSGSDSFVVW
jgi:hypothetical protein